MGARARIETSQHDAKSLVAMPWAFHRCDCSDVALHLLMLKRHLLPESPQIAGAALMCSETAPDSKAQEILQLLASMRGPLPLVEQCCSARLMEGRRIWR